MTKPIRVSEAMQAAQRESDRSTICRLLDAGEPLDAENDRGWAMLNWAAMCGWTDIVRFILDKGADIDHKDSLGGFPLIEAVASERTEVVNLLIARGANVNLVTQGNTALKMAEMVENAEIVQALLAAGAKDIVLTSEGQEWEQEELEKRERQLESARKEFASRDENKDTAKSWVGAWATTEGWGVWVYHADGTIMNCSEFGVSEAGRLDDPGDGTLLNVGRGGVAYKHERYLVSEDGQQLSLYLNSSDRAITMTRL